MNFESFKDGIVEEPSKKKPLFKTGTPPTVPKSEKRSTLDTPRMPDEFEDALKSKTEQREVIDSFVSGIKDWWSGGAKQESMANAEQESGEYREAKEIADERGGIFNSVVERVGKWREENAERFIEGKKEWDKKAPQWEKDLEKDLDAIFRSTPILRAYLMAWDGVVGVDASGTKKINTMESIVKVVTSNVLWGKDVLNVIATIKSGGKIPPNVFDGKTMEVVEWFEQVAREQDPKGEKAVLAGAVKDYLKKNEPTVKKLEAELDGAIEEVAAKV